ncbi:MAG: hypothetical protein NTX72_03790 [Candidatus Uhrbacteria bacterium]|nr:hypothetical protein [Candidatus Uhrbacteria bacterium]
MSEVLRSQSGAKTFPIESTPDNKHVAGFEDQTIDVYKLIELSKGLETQFVDLSRLESSVEEGNNYWHDSNGEWLGPAQIIQEAAMFQGETKWSDLITRHPDWKDELLKIQRADYKQFPIIVIDNVVVDGIHRLTKAFIDGAEKIEIKHFAELPKEIVVPNDV